jgi:hypothetical protein
VVAKLTGDEDGATYGAAVLVFTGAMLELLT